MNKQLILTLLSEAHFSRELMQWAEQHLSEVSAQQFVRPYACEDLANPLRQISAPERLIESFAQLATLQADYEVRGIPLSCLVASLQDLRFRTERFYKQYGFYGLSQHDVRWLGRLYRMEIFDLGSLRFALAHFSYAEIERTGYDYMPLSAKWKKRFPEGTPIIQVHILTGTDFRPAQVDDAFAEARAFFATYFPEHDYEVFVCRTWLLYEPTRALLGAESNIASFAERFTIIAEHPNAKQALDRIYGTDDLAEIAAQVKNTRLARTAYKELAQLGVAAGIIVS